MANRSLGSLTLDLITRIGGFTSGLTQAEREAEKSAKKIEDSMKSIGVAGYAVGQALGQYLKQGIDLAINAFPELIEQVAQFQDIADKTGGSAEGFANFAVSAKVAGVSMDAISDASVKLSKNLIGVGDDTKAAGAALKALNIPIADFKKLAPDEQIKTVANSFAGFADGAGKAAVAQQLFGKSGADLLKFFKDYTDNGGDVNILTGKMIQQADDFADAQTRLRAQLGLTIAALSTNAIGPITAFTGSMKDAINETFGLNKAASDLGANDGVRVFAENVGRSLATAVDFVRNSVKEFEVLTDFVLQSAKALGQVADLDFAGASKTGADFREKYGLDELGRKIGKAGTDIGKTFVQRYDAELAKAKRTSFAAIDPRRTDLGSDGAAKDQRPQLNAQAPAKKAAKGAVDDPTKKLLENDLKAFKAQGDQAKELLADRNKILDLYNSQGLISVKDYYDALRGNAEEATATQSKALDDQIKALRDFQAKAPKETDRADAQGKINDLLTQQSKLQRESGNAAVEMGVKQQQAAQAYRDSLNEVNAKILELDGNLGKAAEIRFDAQNRQLRALAEASGDFASVAQIDRLREYTKAQADINAVQAKFSLAQGDLQIAEERITQARERGTMGEIDGLRASGEARRAAVAVMQEQLKAFEALDAASRTPEQAQAIERLKVQLEGLKGTVDPLADRFNTLFSDAAGNSFGDFITGAKSAKDAFKDFSNTVINEISRMVAKDLARSVFGGGGANSAGGFLSSIFGSGGGASSGGGSDVLGDFIKLGGYANGGFTGPGAANDPAGIVHKGEYVLNAEQTRQIGVANLDKGNLGGATTVFNVNVPAGTSRQTGTQIAAEAERKLASGRRNR